MNVPVEAILRKVGKWIAYADEDLALARYALTMGEACPFHLAAYHAQQCVEKYLKAYLVLCGVDFPPTHNLLRLIKMCPADTPRLSEMDRVVSLTPYAVAARYPGEDEPVTESQAVEAIEIADSARFTMRQTLMDAAFSAHVETVAQRMWPMAESEWKENRQRSV